MSLRNLINGVRLTDRPDQDGPTTTLSISKGLLSQLYCAPEQEQQTNQADPDEKGSASKYKEFHDADRERSLATSTLSPLKLFSSFRAITACVHPTYVETKQKDHLYT